MILLLPAAVFTALYIGSRRRDVRLLRNGVFLVSAAGCLLLEAAVEASKSTPFLQSLLSEVPPLPRSQLDKALAIYRSVPDGASRPLLIPSGGQGANEPRPEEEAMAECLIAHGAAPQDVYSETKSTSTYENLLYSRVIQDSAGRVGSTLVVTNNYHVLRAALQARALGTDSQVIGSPTARYFVPSAFLREYVAIMVEHKRLNGAAILTVITLLALLTVWAIVPS